MVKSIFDTKSTKNKEINEKRLLAKTWLTGQASPTLVIPRKFAIEYGLDKPSHVILEKMEGGILIKKFEL